MVGAKSLRILGSLGGRQLPRCGITGTETRQFGWSDDPGYIEAAF